MATVRDWMSPKVHTLKPLDNLAHAREVMLAQRVNQLPVLAGPRLVGIITDRDVRDAFPSVFEDAMRARRHAQEDSTPERVTVESVMSLEPVTITPDAPLADAVRVMRERRIGALPVLAGDGALAGIITRSDVLAAYLDLAAASS